MSSVNRTEDGAPQQPLADAPISDSHLVEEARDGDRDAYLQLWVRHVETARAVAATASDDPSVEDVVNRAFARVLGQITVDLDPLGPFRPYLLGMIHEEFGVREGEALPPTNVLRAFRRLPVRYQTVLWYCVVEECAPADTAEFMGEEEEAISPLLEQATDQLRAEWAVELVCDPALTDTCAWLVQRSGARSRGELTQVAADRFDRHLAGCDTCQDYLHTLQTFPAVLRDDYLPLFTVERPTGSAEDL